jgi:hypothetical protein
MKSSLVPQSALIALMLLLMALHALVFAWIRDVSLLEGQRTWFGLHFLYFMVAYVVVDRAWSASR